jgi:hypothetical protein
LKETAMMGFPISDAALTIYDKLYLGSAELPDTKPDQMVSEVRLDSTRYIIHLLHGPIQIQAVAHWQTPLQFRMTSGETELLHPIH